jgi:hypothetical protein
VYKSANKGGGWSATNTGLVNTHAYTLAIDPMTPGTVTPNIDKHDSIYILLSSCVI